MTKRCPRCRKSYDAGLQFCPDDGAPLTSANVLDPAIASALASDYRILDFLGSGGMGQVFLAEQIRVGSRKVALKVLHRKFSEDDEFITRFENEAASTGRINHPNVITIYESKRAPDGTLYIAMELVQGESLTDRLRKRGRLALDETVEIVSQSCKALQAAHRLGIIHRDIKPDNIMLAKDDDGALLVKILDFGIAKLKDTSGHTVTGSVLGTPAYMSYEQASGMSSEKLDGRSDIYSLGVVTYTMLAGQPPFRSDTPVGYITKHLTENPSPIRMLRPELSAAVELAVMKAIEKEREKRYQTAAEFGTTLREAARGGTPAPGSTPVPLEPTPTPAPPWRGRPVTGQTTQVEARAPAPPAVPTAPPPAAAAAAPAPSPPAAPPAPAPPPATPVAPTPAVPAASPPTAPAAPTPAAPAAPTPAAPAASPPASPTAPPSAPPTPAAPTPAAPARTTTPRPPLWTPPTQPPGPSPPSPPRPPLTREPTPRRPIVPERPAPIVFERPTGPAAPERRPSPPAAPAAPRPSARRPAPVESEAEAPPRRPAPGEGMAAALWGVRTLVSWGITAYALVLLALFAWPLVAPFVNASVIFPVYVIGQPIVQLVGQWLPSIRFGDLDPLPLVLGVVLLILRPRVTNPLWRLEAQYRARAAVAEMGE